MATREGTVRYQQRFGDAFARTYFRRCGEFSLSSVGIGTYLGPATDAQDERYREALVTAFETGCNVVDTAINYRHQRSERAVGAALHDADVSRDEVFVATKGGFLPFDGERPDDPGSFVQREYVASGLVDADDLAHGSHCIAPAFLDDQLDRSLANLGVERVDCYYVHNPETQLDVRPREAVYDQLEAAFEVLERRAAAGDLRYYGVASWDAFRVDPEHEHFLSLPEVVSRARTAARTVGNESTHLRCLQLPFNVSMADAFTREVHEGPTERQSALWFAHEAGLDVFTSASLGQGDLADGLPDDVAAELGGDTSAQRAINFARSAPGVTTALVGASSAEHVRENVAAGTFEPLGANAFDAVFE
ncbi:aldo/keto reductase [Halospeciosus flavus]|uniref:Aldo/keto reductase n=1 Tax=Halospeciosus flavus TaxID=3032283 RepID=A0ABD5Z641_9EURY|nr:aldo/keto reductase [Halospeciosus flavus]